VEVPAAVHKAAADCGKSFRRKNGDNDGSCRIVDAGYDVHGRVPGPDRAGLNVRFLDVQDIAVVGHANFGSPNPRRVVDVDGRFNLVQDPSGQIVRDIDRRQQAP
jgi:hypothetical protein